jgi:hypothetical protein
LNHGERERLEKKGKGRLFWEKETESTVSGKTKVLD